MEQTISQIPDFGAKNSGATSDTQGYLPSEFVKKALAGLTERSREVLIKRFNLDGGKKRTLQEIGQLFKITRERIRQIEKGSLVRVQEMNSNDLLFFDSVFKSVLLEMGGAAEQNLYLDGLVDFFDKKFLGKIKNREAELQSLTFLLPMAKGINYHPADKNNKNLFFVDAASLAKAEAITAEMIKIFNSEKKPMSFEELLRQAVSQGLAKEGEEGKKILYSYLNLSNVIEKSPFEEWGIKEWPIIFPHSIRDKAYLAVFHEKKPLHFKQITRLIDAKWAKKKKPALAETVHNELIKDKRFVLVGRGIYALAGWGYERGAVRDIIKNILQNAGTPLGREEIIKKVLLQRLVKPGTIVLNLKDKEYFEKTAEGLYKLKM